MSDKPKTLIINTMTEGKYLALSAAGRISDRQLNIVDNDNAGRTVIASYDIVNEKIKNSQLSLIKCIWSAISAYTIYNGQLKSEDQLSGYDIAYSFLNMATNLSAAWTQLNNA